jgi:hypothetical protein
VGDLRLPTVIELDGPPYEKIQCELPQVELKEIYWAGYRETRSRQNGLDPRTCMRHARWIVGDQRLCTQHAGLKILNLVKSGKQGELYASED